MKKLETILDELSNGCAGLPNSYPTFKEFIYHNDYDNILFVIDKANKIYSEQVIQEHLEIASENCLLEFLDSGEIIVDKESITSVKIDLP